jgi:hypothetical protein
MGSTPNDSLKGRVEVALKLKNGKEVSHLVEVAKGDPKNPMTAEEVYTKYLDCARLVLSGADARKTLDTIIALEALDDISTLMGMLNKPTAGGGA